MTLRIMSTTLGPSLQAGSRYTMGVLNALLPLGYISFMLTHFLLSYTAAISLVTAAVNGHLAALKVRQSRATSTTEASRP